MHACMGTPFMLSTSNLNHNLRSSSCPSTSPPHSHNTKMMIMMMMKKKKTMAAFLITFLPLSLPTPPSHPFPLCNLLIASACPSLSRRGLERVGYGYGYGYGNEDNGEDKEEGEEDEEHGSSLELGGVEKDGFGNEDKDKDEDGEEEDGSSLELGGIVKNGYGDEDDDENRDVDNNEDAEEDQEDGFSRDVTAAKEEEDWRLLESPYIKAFRGLLTIDSIGPSLQQGTRISTHNNDEEEEEEEIFDEVGTTAEEDGKLLESPYIKIFHSRHAIDSVGPSLQRGIRISTHNNGEEEDEEEEDEGEGSGRDATTAKEDEKLLESPYVKASHGQPPRLDRHAFARTYVIPALRMPAAECSSMVARLRGHLLNWPHIGNVARVPGDDIDENLKKLLWNDAEKEEEESPLNALRSAVYGVKALPEDDPWRVSQRMELAKKVGHFKALARLSRPLRDQRDRKGQVKKGATKTKAGGRTRPPLYTVKAFDEAESAAHPNAQGQGSVGMIGETLRMKPWPGPTRLLLLDEEHLGKPTFSLPMAIQVVLENPKVELVKCHLKICYEYWPVDEILRELLPAWMQIPTTFETIGHIAHLNLREEHLPYKHAIAQVVLDKYEPRIKTVVNKTEAIKNQFRTKQLEVLAGNRSLVTSLVENGIRYHINLATVYWSSRLATERQRLIQLFHDSDILCDVFAGVGPITVAAAKKVKRVVANDLNSEALMYLSKNISQNNLQAKVELFNMDGREFIREILSFQKPVLITQVVMNLPTDAIEFLDAFIGAFNKDSWGEQRSLPMIHVYGFSKAADPEGEIKERILQVMQYAPDEYSMHRVRLVAPGKWMICASFRLPHIIAFQPRNREVAS